MNYLLLTALGLRVYPNQWGQLRLPEGGFGQERNGRWLLRPPTCDTVGLAPEAITEHPDGTISALRRIKSKGVSFTNWELRKGVWINLDAQEALTRITSQEQST